jgi:membrane protein
MSIIYLFRDSLKAYFGDRSIMYAAGLAYYAVFAVAPLLVFVVTLAGVFIGRSNAFDKIVSQAQYLVGPQLAGLLAEMAETIIQRTFTAGGTLFSVLGLLFSAAGIFSQLDQALNDIWGIKTIPPQSLTDRLILFRHKTAPFMVVFFLGLLLSSSVIVDTFLVSVTDRLSRILPQIAGIYPQINRLIIPIISFAIFTVIFKWLPDAHSRWRDVAVGGLVTTLLFTIGRQLLRLYLAHSDTVSLYGTAGSIVVLLIWVYYSAQIVLFGAEFTKIYADRYGQPIEPRKMAVFEDALPTTAAMKPKNAPPESSTPNQDNRS